MARYPIRDQVAIVGVGSTGFSRDAGGRSSKSLACEASIAAVRDAGLQAKDIDGIVGACAGSCSCGTCHVYIEEPWQSRLPRRSREEDDKLDEVAAEVKKSSRMACRITLTPQLEGMVVRVPPTQG